MTIPPKKGPHTWRAPCWLPAILLLLGLLTACGAGLEPSATAPTPFTHTLTVELAADASRAVVEAEFGGRIVAWHPEAGFAVLGLDEAAAAAARQQLQSNRARPKNGSKSFAALEPAPNLDVMEMPEVQAEGFTSWSGGFTSWSGGFTSWSGGFTSWSGGFTSWSGGSPEPTTFAENVPLWQQIRLPEAERLAPQLGAGVKVAVIDTGIDLRHPGFDGKLAPADEWRDFVDGDSYPMDEPGGPGYGHGTAVAGIVIQVAPNATILPLRVLGPDGFGDVDDVVAAIDHALAMGADVINLSLGTHADVPALAAIVKYAEEQKVIVASSAGNTGDDRVTYPGAYDFDGTDGGFAISVGSVDVDEVKSSFSTYGDALSIVAPGEFVTTLAPDARVAYWSGTSMAAPIVAGAAALGLAEVTEAWQRVNLDQYLTFNATLIDRYNKSYRHQLGWGRLDVEAFLVAMGLNQEW